MSTIVFNVNFGGSTGIIDIAALGWVFPQFEISDVCHNTTFQPIKNSGKFKIQDETGTFIGYMSNVSDNFIPAIFYVDGVVYFNGYIRNNFSGKFTDYSHDVSIELIDKSKDLERSLAVTISMENADICDTADPDNSILHQLLLGAGFGVPMAFGITGIDLAQNAFGITGIDTEENAYGILSANFDTLIDIPITLDYYFKSRFEDYNYYQLIQDLLKEAGYCLVINAEGNPVLKSLIYRSEAVTSGTTREFLIHKGFTLKRNNIRIDSFTGKYFEHETILKATVFNDTTGGNNVYDCLIEVATGDDYPTDAGDPAVVTKLDFKVEDVVGSEDKDKGKVLILAKYAGAYIDIRPVDYFSAAKVWTEDLWYGTSVDNGAHNDSGVARTLIKFKVIADAIVQGPSQEYTATVANLSVNNNETMDFEYVYDSAVIKTVVDGYLDNAVYGKYPYNFVTSYDLDLGGYYDIEDDVITNITYSMKIISKTPVWAWTKTDGLHVMNYKYGAISFDQVVSIDTEEIVSNPTKGRSGGSVFREATLTAEGLANPTPPYELGDTWIKDDGYYDCTIRKDIGDAYDFGDWTKIETNPAEIPLAILHEPLYLGAILEDPTPDDVFLHAIDHTGAIILDEDGKVLVEGVYATVPYGAVTVANGTWYMFKETTGGTVQLATYDYTNVRFEVGGSPMTAGFFFAEVIAAAGVVTNIDIYQTAKLEAEMVAHYMRLTMQTLAGVPAVDFEATAKGLGIEQAFLSLAVYQAFITYLNVVNVTAGDGDGTGDSGLRFRVHTYDGDGAPLTTPIWDVYYGSSKIFEIVPSTGDILFGDYDEVEGGGLKWENNTKRLLSKNGNLIIGADGKIKATDAKLIGTLQTGIDASSSARVAIRDESGITSGPTFTGTGDDNMYITEEGAAAGSFEVVIVAAKVTYDIGDVGPGGGYIFYKSNSGGVDTYLECAPASARLTGKYFSVVGDRDYTSTAFGSGQANTTLLKNKYSGYPLTQAVWADALTSGGKSDWFIPSYGEASYIKTNLMDAGLGGFSSGDLFFTSSEGSNYAHAYRFGPASWGEVYYKPIQSLYTLPIREFSVSAGTFKWKEVGGSYSSNINLVAGVETTLTSYDIKITFSSEVGTVVGDKWEFTQGAMRGLSILDNSGAEYVEASNGVLTCTKVVGDTVEGAVGNDFVDNIEAPLGWLYGFAHLVKGDYYGMPSDTASIKTGQETDHTMPRAIAGFALMYVDQKYSVNTKLTYTKTGILTKKKWWMKTPVVALYYMDIRHVYWNKVPVKGRVIVKVVM